MVRAEDFLDLVHGGCPVLLLALKGELEERRKRRIAEAVSGFKFSAEILADIALGCECKKWHIRVARLNEEMFPRFFAQYKEESKNAFTHSEVWDREERIYGKHRDGGNGVGEIGDGHFGADQDASGRAIKFLRNLSRLCVIFYRVSIEAKERRIGKTLPDRFFRLRDADPERCESPTFAITAECFCGTNEAATVAEECRIHRALS